MKTVKFVPDPHQKLKLSDIEEIKLDSLSDEDIAFFIMMRYILSTVRLTP
jgi:hypothetical protein